VSKTFPEQSPDLTYKDKHQRIFSPWLLNVFGPALRFCIAAGSRLSPNNRKTACYGVHMPKQPPKKAVETEKATEAARQALSGDGYRTKPQIARLFQKSERTIEHWTKAGIIPCIKLGRGRRATVLYDWPVIKEHLASRFSTSVAAGSRYGKT
jgi:hypothetical protein